MGSCAYFQFKDLKEAKFLAGGSWGMVRSEKKGGDLHSEKAISHSGPVWPNHHDYFLE